MGKRGTWSTLQYARLCNNKRRRFWSLGRHKLLSSPSVYLPEKCINLAKVLTSNDTQSDIQSTLSRARATQNFVGFAKQSVNRKAFLVRTIWFFHLPKFLTTATKNYFASMTNLVPDANKATKRTIGDYKNFQIFCQRQTLFFVVVRTGSQTHTFGKSTIFSSFEDVR